MHHAVWRKKEHYSLLFPPVRECMMKELWSEFEEQIAFAQRVKENIRKQSLKIHTICLKKKAL